MSASAAPLNNRCILLSPSRLACSCGKPCRPDRIVTEGGGPPLGPVLPLPVKRSVLRGEGKSIEGRELLHLDAGEVDNLLPLRGLVGDDLAELTRRRDD